MGKHVKNTAEKENVKKVEDQENIKKVEDLEGKVEKIDIEETEGVAEETDDVNVLGEKSENTSESGCSHCKKENPSKRCSKRHPKCMKKMFCNETCEELAHKKKESTAVAKPGAKKLDVKKKKGKSKSDKPSGEFWWNNTVYASW